ncbi:MAG: glycosyltransferase [Kofleriaceae bacterium]
MRGRAASEVLDELANRGHGDADWRDGRVFSLVYKVPGKLGEAHDDLLQRAHALYASTNLLNPIAFKSLKQMERDLIEMTGRLFHCAGAVGTVTSGGTESILCAVAAYRDRARRERPWIRWPQLVVPTTIHPAFDKAAHYFGIDLVKVPVGADLRANVKAMAKAIGWRTIGICASAPQYPHGVIDPIAELGALAQRKKLPLHVDACVASLTALQRLSAAHTRQLQLDFVSDFFEFIDQSRAHYQAADADVEDRFSCLAVNLIPAAGSRARALAPYLLADDSEDYERVFDELAAASWQQWGSRRPSPAPERAKILFVNYNGNPYGATRLLELWLGRWNQTRFELVVTQPSENALLEQTRERYRTHYLQVRWPNAQYVPLAGRSWTDALSASRRILDEERPDLVWLHGFVPAMAVAARLTGIPSICFAQTPVFGANPALGALVLRSAALEASDLIIGCATSYEHALRQVFRPPAGRMTSSPVGLDTTLYDPARHDRAAARAKFGVPLEGPVVLSASALIPFKRPDVTVRSFHRLLARLPDATLVMAGAEVGPIKGYARTIQLLAEELGIGERVKLLGFVEDMPAMYAAADVLVHTSITEPFGMVITEAMAMGLPVVGMDAYGPGEQIVHGTTGYKIAPPGDPDVIAAALFEVLTRPDHAAELGRAGRARARELYDLERQVRTLEQTCLDVIAATSRAGAG